MDEFLAIILMNGGFSLKLAASFSAIYSDTSFDGAGAADLTDTPCDIGSPDHLPAPAIRHFAEKNLK